MRAICKPNICSIKVCKANPRLRHKHEKRQISLMNINRFYSMLVLLCLFFTAQRASAQCSYDLSVLFSDIYCFGGQGAIDLVVEGSTGPYTYVWSNGQTEEDIAGLLEGTYTVTVTDVGGCSSIFTQNITSPAEPLSLVLNDEGLISCQNPQSDIVPDISGGNVPYSFFWSNGSTNDVLPVGVPGTYTVTVTDAGNCTITAQKAIQASPNFPIADAGPSDVYLDCAGGLNKIGGPGTSTGPQFVYQWSTFLGVIDPGADPNQQTLEVTAWGNYELRVTNILEGCWASDLVFVNLLGPLPTATAQSPVILDCGTTQVFLNAIGSSSGPNFSTVWSTGDGHIVSGANTLSPLVDAPGTYILTVTNALQGCVNRAKVIVTDQNQNFVKAGSDTGIPCAGGMITLDGSGSASGPQYSYQWSTVDGNVVSGATSLNPGVDQAGIYVLKVTDEQTSCTKMDTVQVFPGPIIPPQDFSVVGINCDRTVAILDCNMNQGTAPYSYLWSNGETQAAIFNGNLDFTITVSDATGCKYYGAIEGEPPSMSLSAYSTAANCAAGGNGTINLIVDNTYAPIIYLWNNGATTQDLNSLNAGTYIVTVTFGSSCTQTFSVGVANATDLSLSTIITNANSCAGLLGSIDLTVTGGMAPYVYAWSNGELNEDLSMLDAGTYTVTVTDATGCSPTMEATIGDTPPFTLSINSTPANCGQNDGAVDLSVTGGTGPFTYFWSNGETNQDMINLAPGIYMPTVVDATGCSQTSSTTVEEVSNLVLSAIPTHASCNGFDGAVDLTATGGTAPYQYIWDNGATTEDINNVPMGDYDVTVTDVLGCTKTTNAIVNQLSDVVITPTVVDATCTGVCNGSVDLALANGTAPFTFLWSHGSTDQNLANHCPNTYTVVVSDANGCTQSASVTIGQTSDFAMSTSVTDATCFGACDGSIDLTVTGGVFPYTYDWSNSSTAQDLDNLCAGTYSIIVTDAIGCLEKSILTVNQPTNLVVNMVVTNISCFGGNDGGIDLTVTGGTGPYTYDWAHIPGTNNPADPNNLSGANYSCTITDSNGCTKAINMAIGGFTALSLSNTTNNVLCFGGNNGSIDLSVSGGAGSYIYFWSTNSTANDLIGLAAGTYTVTVTDLNGCSKTLSATVSQSTAITTSGIVNQASCSGNSDGWIDISTIGGIPPYTYLWSNGSALQDLQNLTSGTYTVTITDANGCTATSSYTITQSAGGNCGAIKGLVFHDEDESCSFDFPEPGLTGWIVRAEGTNDTLYGVTDAQGKYLLGVPVGTYAMKVLIPNGLWSVCPGGPSVTVNMAGDTVSGGDFPVQSIFICPALTVSLGTSQLRRCFSNNYYQVEYCNTGTAIAEDAYITVVLDPLLTALSASVPYTDLGSNAIQVQVGDLGIGECGMFNIQVYVSCNAQLGQTHCTEVFIYPDTLCVPTNANWSGANVNVSSLCSTDSLRFTIQNTGKAGMASSSNYIVVEDGIMFRTGTVAPLGENESMQVVVPANGSTWRLEVEQAAFHPFSSPVGLSVEGCASTLPFSLGFVNQFSQPDEPPTVDIDCTTNIGSFDPNDKYGYPVGYGADHYIRPGTDIEYLIRFQNTGTDTAFRVEIIDTLSTWLDPASIRFGASSHPYRYDLNGEGIVHFIFEDIILPDSNINEVASHGFAKFIIKPRLDVPLETRIENTAAIYFDFNDPVFTNTTFHRLGENFVTVGLWQPEKPEASVVAVPNPFNEQTILEIKGLAKSTGLNLQVFDLQGRVVREMESENGLFLLKKGDWPSGIYLFKITQNGQLVGNGKLMAE